MSSTAGEKRLRTEARAANRSKVGASYRVDEQRVLYIYFEFAVNASHMTHNEQKDRSQLK